MRCNFVRKLLKLERTRFIQTCNITFRYCHPKRNVSQLSQLGKLSNTLIRSFIFKESSISIRTRARLARGFPTNKLRINKLVICQIYFKSLPNLFEIHQQIDGRNKRCWTSIIFLISICCNKGNKIHHLWKFQLILWRLLSLSAITVPDVQPWWRTNRQAVEQK